MHLLLPTGSSNVVEYLNKEVPWELERLESLDQLMSAGSNGLWPEPHLLSDVGWIRDERTGASAGRAQRRRSATIVALAALPATAAVHPGQLRHGRGVRLHRMAGMPRPSWSRERDRQFRHVRDGLEAQGRPAAVSEESAAPTVSKEWTRRGEAGAASGASIRDISSGRRGGFRSQMGPGGRTKQKLYAEARRQRVPGRSTMSKAQLERAVERHRGS